MTSSLTTPVDTAQEYGAPQPITSGAQPKPVSRGSPLPELLAPAGDWDCARAAVENGADAIYFGLEKFNARMRAQNFTGADLPRLMEFLHRRGVKGYVSFNTLVFENEMAEAEQYARAMIAAGVDAAIVQDVGICRLIRQLSPDFPIHVSTQMTVTSAAGVAFARELGCNLVVLARECSLKDIEKIQAAPLNHQDWGRSELSPAQDKLPLEVFIHGALCVAYSGQCLTSEALGGRSANRGECAQACRLPYELIAEGRAVPLGDRKYLLSPQDLAGLEVFPELLRLGVASLKIEGRLKSSEYVANITRIYRQALDELGRPQDPDDGRSLPTQSPGAVPHVIKTPTATPPNRQYDMEMAFSRGLFTGWFRGVNNQQLVHGRFGKKRGVYLGEVLAVNGDGVIVSLRGPLKPGDGVVFDAGSPEEREEGGRVYGIQAAATSTGGDEPFRRVQTTMPRLHRPAIKRRNPVFTSQTTPSAPGAKPVLLSFGHGDVDLRRVHVGDKLWKTNDPALDRRLRQTFASERPNFPRPVFLEVHGSTGRPLTLIARDELGNTVQLDSAISLVSADKQPLTAERLRAQLGRLGGTAYRLGSLNNGLSGSVLLPLSELNRLRRDAVRELDHLRSQPKRWTLNEDSTPVEQKVGHFASSAPGLPPGPPHLAVLLRNLAQLEQALQCEISTLYCDFEDPKKYREAVRLVRAAGNSSAGLAHGSREIFVAPPRIFRMGEDWTLKQVRSCKADGYLVRNYDHLDFFAHDRRVGDYSLNVANRLAADYFKTRFGLERLTASYDLNCVQLEALLQAAPPDWFEITVHQHMPMFHMEHCVFCAFLTSGTDYTNCGRPCDRVDLKLRDRVGAEHPVKADMGCRNTVFNARAQTGADHVSRLLNLGARHFRLEFLNEPPAQVAQTIAKYRQLLRGAITGAELWHELKLLNQLGVTRGPMGR